MPIPKLSLRLLCLLLIPLATFLGYPPRTALASTAWNALATEGDPAGVVVQSIEQGSALKAAGLLPGDLVLAWTRSAQPAAKPEISKGMIKSFFDWLWLEAEQAQRGGIRLIIRRDGGILSLDVPSGKWDIKVRPAMPISVLAPYEEGKALIDQKKAAEGAALWTKLLETEPATSEWTLRCWLHLRTGIAWEWAQQWDRAHTEYRLAAAEARIPIAQAYVLETTGKTYSAQQSFAEAQTSFLRAMEIWQSSFGEGLGVARLNFFLGALASYHSRTELEELYFGRAAALQERLAPESFDLGLTLHFLANTAIERGDLTAAEHRIQKASAIWSENSPDSLYMAAVQDVLASIAQKRGDYVQRQRVLLKGLEIRERLAPDSVDMATSLKKLAELSTETGDFDKATSYLERALAIREKFGRENLSFASLLSALAHVAGRRGDPSQEEVYLNRALVINQRIAPGTIAVASSFHDISKSARDRGDIALAWEYGLESLFLYQKIVPGSLNEANILNTLAGIAEARNDLELAKFYCERSLEIVSKLVPQGADMASLLSNLANLEIQQGTLEAAQNHLEHALDLWQQNDPKNIHVAITLVALGVVAQRRGLLDLAQHRYKEALRIQELAAADSLDVLPTLRNLGEVAVARGDFTEALRTFERALSIAQRLAPSSLAEADLFHLIGGVHRRVNHSDKALLNYRNAVQALEAQFMRLGGTQDVQAGFGAQHEVIYRNLLDLLIEQGKPEEAIVVLERSRARSILRQLERRDLAWPLDLPVEKEKELRRLRIEYDEIQARISKLDPREDEVQIEGLRGHLHEMRQRYAETVSALLNANPRFAGLRRPEPLDLSRMRQALAPGTLALLFDVSNERVHLFALSFDAPLRFRTLSLREEDLRRDIELLLGLSAHAPASPAVQVSRERAMAEASARLYDLLLGPVNDLVLGSSRLLFVPDGPLHRLPWGVLTVPEPGQATRRSLIERKPYHVSLSITVYDQIRRLPRISNLQESPFALAAFGDPLFPFSSEDLLASKLEPRVRSAIGHGFRFDPLPASRGEVERIVTLYPGAHSSFLGAEATEENAKALPRDTRIVHFSTHATLDDQSPLDSAVVLSIPAKLEEGKDNGLLQAWEIFEQVRLNADLVVLSTCESGLGKDLGGEGLIGLTRAFQYAGARSVLASLWKISDRTTAELMVRFYRHLKEGKTKDEALRAAQIELIRGPIEITNEKGEIEKIDASAPYYWAAFQLYGDWQ